MACDGAMSEDAPRLETLLYAVEGPIARITLTEESITSRFLRRREFRWSQLDRSELMNRGLGMRLHFIDGRQLVVRSTMKGYADFTSFLARKDKSFEAVHYMMKTLRRA